MLALTLSRTILGRLYGRRLEIRIPGIHDLALENSALRSKGAMFTDIFGYDIILIPEE